MSRQRILGLSVVGAGAIFALASGQGNAEPSELLKKALSRPNDVHAVLVQTRGETSGGPGWTLKAQHVPKKGTTVTVLQPISRQGHVSVDDSRQLQSFDPDENEVVVQPSPRLVQPSPDWRMRLVRSNYSVAWGRTRTLAGRTTREIIVDPKHDGIPQRRISVDPENGLILRYVIDPPGQRATVLLDTRSFVLDVATAKQDFGLPREARDATRRVLQGPKAFTKGAESVRGAGFAAKLPTEPPFGFRIYGRHLIGEGADKFVAVRLSDGMCLVSVYQWKLDRFEDGPPLRPSSVRQTSDGVGFAILSQSGERLPDSTLKAILSSFVGPGA